MIFTLVVITFIIFLQRPKFISSLHPRSSGANRHNGHAGAAGEIMLLVLKKASLFCIGDLASNKSNRPRLIKLLYCAQSARHIHPWFHFEILMLMRKLVRIDCINVDLARMSPVRRCWLQCHYSLHQLQWYSLRPGPPGIYMPLCCWKVWLSEMSVSMFRSFDEFFNVPGTCWLFILSHDYPWYS